MSDATIPTSRRPRLWELEHKHHCPIVGVCFDLQQIRRLAGKVLQITPKTPDFDIHVTAVRECSSRSTLAKLLQKDLDQRYGLLVQQYRQLKTAAELAERWQAALQRNDIAGPLWATLTHPACDADLKQALYGDVHMLQHQVGAGQRADTATLRKLQEQNQALARELAATQEKFATWRDQQVAEMEAMKRQLGAAREECVRQEQAAAQHLGALEDLRASLPELERPLQLARRAQQAEARCLALRARVGDLEQQLAGSEKSRLSLEAALLRPTPAPTPEPEACPVSAEALSGRAVLCVGGRTGNASLYRNMVERLGGRFLHHDGGVEENLGRLEYSIQAADAVICQAGCISHNAYWRVKETCKRSGKPCLFVKNPSLSSFIRGLEHLASETPQE